MAASVNQVLGCGNSSVSQLREWVLCVCAVYTLLRDPAISVHQIIHILDKRKLQSSRTLQKVITN